MKQYLIDEKLLNDTIDALAVSSHGVVPRLHALTPVQESDEGRQADEKWDSRVAADIARLVPGLGYNSRQKLNKYVVRTIRKEIARRLAQPPVVVTREAVEWMVAGWMEAPNADGEDGIICVVGPKSRKELIDSIYALQLPQPQPSGIGEAVRALEELDTFLSQIVSVEPEGESLWIGTVKANAYGYLREVRQALATLKGQTAPSVQEARGVDLSGVKRWHMDIRFWNRDKIEVVPNEYEKGQWVKFDDLTHLQQAPQGVGEWIPVARVRNMRGPFEGIDSRGVVGYVVNEGGDGWDAWDINLDDLVAVRPLPPAPVKVADQ